MTRLLSEAQRSLYAQEGILFPVRVLSPEEARRYRHACDDLEAHLGGKPRTIEVRQMHLHFRWAYELATQPRLLDALADLLGPDLLIWATELFAKHPRDPAVSINWHRDRRYMGFVGETATAWVALTESTVANGCMRAVPGLARGELRSSDQSPGRPPQQAALDVNKEGVVDVLLGPGEMSLHDADILHGSAPNRSDEKRVGFVIRFVTPEARPLAGRPPVVLVRGADRRNHFHVVDPPAETNGERALAGMRESAALHLEAMLQNLRRVGP
jgi:hypothetical protein